MLPRVAVVEAIESHEGFGAGPVPAAASSFEPLSGRFALSFRRSAADLPAATAELRIANHGLPLLNIGQEAVSGRTLASPQVASPSHEMLPTRAVAPLIKLTHHFLAPCGPGGVLFSIHGQSSALHILSQVV